MSNQHIIFWKLQTLGTGVEERGGRTQLLSTWIQLCLPWCSHVSMLLLLVLQFTTWLWDKVNLLQSSRYSMFLSSIINKGGKYQNSDRNLLCLISARKRLISRCFTGSLEILNLSWGFHLDPRNSGSVCQINLL